MDNEKVEFRVAEFLKRNKKRNVNNKQAFSNPNFKQQKYKKDTSKRESPRAKSKRSLLQTPEKKLNIELQDGQKMHLMNQNSNKAIKIQNTTPKALNDFFYSSFYRKRDNVKLSNNDLFERIPKSPRANSDLRESISGRDSLAEKLVSAGPLRNSKIKEEKSGSPRIIYDPGKRRQRVSIFEEIEDAGSNMYDLPNKFFAKTKISPKKTKMISIISPIDIGYGEGHIGNSESNINGKPPLIPAQNIPSEGKLTRKSAPLKPSKSSINIFSSNSGFKSYFEKKILNKSRESLGLTGEQGSQERNNRNLNLSFNKSQNKLENLTERGQLNIEGELNSQFQMAKSVDNKHHRNILKQNEKEGIVKSFSEKKNKLSRNSGQMIGSDKLREKINNIRREEFPGQVSPFSITPNTSLRGNGNSTNVQNEDTNGNTHQINHVKHTPEYIKSSFSEEERKRLGTSFEILKSELVRLQVINKDLKNKIRNDKAIIIQNENTMNNYKTKTETFSKEINCLMCKNNELSSDIIIMSKKMEVLSEELEKERNQSRSTLDKSRTFSEIMRAKTPMIRRDNKRGGDGEGRSASKSFSEIGRSKSPLRSIDPRKDSAIFQEYSKEYSIDKHLNQIEDKELIQINPPKSRIFINYIKLFGLNIASFYPGKGEKDILSDPNFQEDTYMNRSTEQMHTSAGKYSEFSDVKYSFVSFLAKLQIHEEQQRLKAEEQSANVIDQLNRNINKLEEQNGYLKYKLKEANIDIGNNLNKLYTSNENTPDNNFSLMGVENENLKHLKLLNSSLSPTEITLNLEQ